jgi:transposase-like protein
MAKKLRDLDKLFKSRHVERDRIILCARWYSRYKLSYRDLVEMMVERGLHVAHTTIMRWVQRYVPEFEKHCPVMRAKPADRGASTRRT